MNLNVSSLFFELALIFMPGFIWMKIHTRYGAKGEDALGQGDSLPRLERFGRLAALVARQAPKIGRTMVRGSLPG